ncbi:hypothetical protein GA0115240_10751, partial [Streptomyces sp. DvalAA-14]
MSGSRMPRSRVLIGAAAALGTLALGAAGIATGSAQA